MSDDAAIDPLATSQRIRGVLAPVYAPAGVAPPASALAELCRTLRVELRLTGAPGPIPYKDDRILRQISRG